MFDTHVVDDEQVASEVALHGALVLAVLSVGAQIDEDVEDGAVEHHFPGFDQLVPDGLSEVTFINAGRAYQQDVFGAFEEGSGREVVDLFAIYGAVEAEVEAVEGALFAEVGTLGAAFDHALVAYIEFVLQEQFQELEVVELVAAGFAQA